MMALSSKNILEVFSEVAHQSPNKVAMELNEQIWTYGELLMNVNCISSNLDIEAGEIVYQYVDRSLEMVCGLLGIMCAGGVYCPLCPSDSPLYIHQVINETHGRYVLVHENTSDRFASTANKPIHMINIERVLFTPIREEANEKAIHILGSSPSFIIGAIDRQNLVVHTHASLLSGVHNLINWETGEGDRVLHIVETSTSFVHLCEILLPLLIIPSGTLVLLPPADNLNTNRFGSTIKDKQITIFFVESALLEVFIEYLESNEIPEKRHILCVLGHSPNAQHLVQIKNLSPRIRIFLVFGTAETNAALGYEIKETIGELADLSVLPIGYPLSEYRCLLVDNDSPEPIVSPLDKQRSGQIYLTGDGIFQCYYNNPESTGRTRIVIDSEEFFKTANLARYNDQGALVHAGRIDSAVTITENELPFPGFVRKSFFCLSQTTIPRYQCLKLITWPWFERISMFVILLNCITLGMYTPCAHQTNTNSSEKCNTSLCIWLEMIDYFVLGFFTVEMLITMIAMGLVGKGTYLAESWNRLDCFIVVSGLIELMIPGDNVGLTAIRSVRLLRPLRAINRVPSIRILVMLILDTLPMLRNVLLLCFFIFFIFGIVGVQLWKGVLRNRCFLQVNTTIRDDYALFDDRPLPSFYTPSDQDSFICSNLSSSGMTKCSEIPKYRQEDTTCELSLNSSLINNAVNGCINWNQYYQFCSVSDQNPFSGVINFDNIASAWLTIFQMITLENWSGIMYYIQDAHSFWNWIYFVSLIVVGSFIMINLCLVVISEQFRVTKKRETEEILAKQRRFSYSATAATIDNQVSFWEELITYFQQLLKSLYKRFGILWKSHRHGRVNRNVTTPNTVLSTPLIHESHLPNCRYHQSKSMDADNGVPHINLELEQQTEINGTCDCYHIDEAKSKTPSKYETSCSSIHRFISRFVSSKYFEHIIFTAIILNTLSMSIEHHGQPQTLTKILEYTNYIFTALFTIEMIMKIIAYGFLEYIKDVFNIFDGGIVLISLVELYATKHSGLSVLRTFRLLRVLKLVEFMPTLRKQVVVMVKTLDNVAAFLLLLFLFMFIFSVFGMHLFGGKFCTIEAFNKTSREHLNINCRCCTCMELNSLRNSTDTEDLTCTQARANFDSLLFALLTVFQILTQANWTEILYNAMLKTNPWSAVYFIALMVFGNYILLNLLIAILVDGFANEKDDDDTTKTNPSTENLDQTNPLKAQAIATRHTGAADEIEETIVHSADLRRRTHSDPSFLSRQKLMQQPAISVSCDGISRREENYDKYTDPDTCIQPPAANHNHIELYMANENNTPIESTDEKSGVARSCLNCCREQGIFNCLHKRKSYSLYLFSPSNRLRNVFQRLIVKKPFDYFILFFIAFNCITIAMERPSIPPRSLERQFLNYTNYVFTCIFTLEMLIKIIASGFICQPNAYLRSGWNVMDGFLVIISIVDVCMGNRDDGLSHTESDSTSRILAMLRVFRILRALRPLRVIQRAPGLKLVVQTLLSSMGPIVDTAIICCISLIIFAILGVQLFKGKLYYCEGPLAHNVTTREQCESMSQHRWENQQYNFDNLGQALLTLFIVASRDGWVEIMYSGIDAVDVDMQPRRNYSQSKLIYFISFLLIVSFFVLNMFVGVVIENFQKCQAQHDLEVKAQNDEKHEKELQDQKRLLKELPYDANYSSWRKWLHDTCTNKYFDLVIIVIIGLNVIAMSLEFYQMPSTLEKCLEYSNYVFTGVFILEFLWKIIALGPIRYFKDKWNQLDSSIVFLSIAGIVMEKMKSQYSFPINPTIIRVMRVLRIARVLRLLKTAKGIRTLLDTVIHAFPQVGNLSLLFLLLFFIFAALGVELFGKLKCNEEQPCSGLNKHAHFKNFGIALLTLFRVSTGDNWNGILKDTLRKDESSRPGMSWFMPIVSPVYFVSFVLLAQFVLINIVVAVLMKKLEESNDAMDDDNENEHDRNDNQLQSSSFEGEGNVDITAKN